jgi:hypothetical protein
MALPRNHVPAELIYAAFVQRAENGEPVRVREQDADALDDKTVAALQRLAQSATEVSVFILDDFFPHYFHFIETLLTLYAVQHEFFPEATLQRLYIRLKDWNNPRQADVQQHLLGHLYPDLEIITDPGPTPVFEEHLIQIDRMRAHTPLNKMIEPILFLVAKWSPALRSDIYRALDIVPRPNRLDRNRPKLLYVRRDPPRRLTPEAETAMLGFLAGRAEIVTVDFTGMSWADQVRVSADADIMVGVHGNGLTNAMWLPPQGTVIEIFPDRAHHYDYQMLSEAMGLDYFGFERDTIFRPFSRHGPSYGHDDHVAQPVSNPYLAALALALEAIEARTRRDQR